MLRSSADLELYDSEVQTERAQMLKNFTDNASTINGTENNSLPDDYSLCSGLQVAMDEDR